LHLLAFWPHADALSDRRGGCGPYRLVSLLTREAVDELKLAPGVRVVAAVKATNVVIELSR
jgi:molybdopterin-binding protein